MRAPLYITDTAPGGERRTRVYGHRLGEAAPKLSDRAPNHRWISAAELSDLVAAEQLADGAQVQQWLHMWQGEVDEEDRPVTRSFGLPSTDVQYYAYNGNGNPQGTYRIGVFDQQGRPTPVPEKLAKP